MFLAKSRQLDLRGAFNSIPCLSLARLLAEIFDLMVRKLPEEGTRSFQLGVSSAGTPVSQVFCIAVAAIRFTSHEP